MNFVLGIKSMYIDIFDFFGFWLLDEAAHAMAVFTFLGLVAACIYVAKEKLPWFQEYKKETADDVMEKLREKEERNKVYESMKRDDEAWAGFNEEEVPFYFGIAEDLNSKKRKPT